MRWRTRPRQSHLNEWPGSTTRQRPRVAEQAVSGSHLHTQGKPCAPTPERQPTSIAATRTRRSHGPRHKGGRGRNETPPSRAEDMDNLNPDLNLNEAGSRDRSAKTQERTARSKLTAEHDSRHTAPDTATPTGTARPTQLTGFSVIVWIKNGGDYTRAACSWLHPTRALLRSPKFASVRPPPAPAPPVQRPAAVRALAGATSPDVPRRS